MLKHFAFPFFCLLASVSFSQTELTKQQLRELKRNPQFIETGIASYYHRKFNGRKTANGERFSSKKYTAAHKTLPFGTVVKVVNLENQKSVLVRINDRGPFVRKRVIDLSRVAAEEIGLTKEKGLVKVILFKTTVKRF